MNPLLALVVNVDDPNRFSFFTSPGLIDVGEVKLAQQAASNTKEQFATSPDLSSELLNAIIEALDAHSEMSSQALESKEIQQGLKEILLGPAELYDKLRAHI